MPAAAPASADDELGRLKRLSLEELANIEVSIASNRPQKVFESPAAVFVITDDDIRRSSATSIPELLRMVPGLDVARIDGNKWSVTARGFSGRFANKLLVLIDGRSVYTPLFSGVFWEVQDTLLADIERIEVVRGPGASVWGANAVNGVINIITKHARDTQGGLAIAGGGTEERAFAAVRYGGTTADGHFRVYAKAFEREPSTFVDGARATDDAGSVRAGFRTDFSPAPAQTLTVQGDIYRKRDGQRVSLPSLTTFVDTFDETAHSAGGNLLTRWERSHADASTSTVLLILDRTLHDEAALGEQRNTIDAEFRRTLAPIDRHRVVWGLGVRATERRLRNSFSVGLEPPSASERLFSAFAQDEIGFDDGRWQLTLGSKLEHNEQTGYEIEPNVRLLWLPTPHQAAWAAVSRAVRTPSEGERLIVFNSLVLPTPPSPPTFGLPLVVRRSGSPDFVSETLIAWEAGYRVNLSDRLHVNVAGFYNDYDRLSTSESAPPFLETTPLPPHLVLPYHTANKMQGNTRGIEIGADWRPRSDWRVRVAYSLLRMRLRADPDSAETSFQTIPGESPRWQIYASSAIDLAHNVELDVAARRVAALPVLNVPAYTAVDLRLGWKAGNGLELSLQGRNLFDPRHLEYQPTIFPTAVTEAQRAVFGKATWRF